MTIQAPEDSAAREGPARGFRGFFVGICFVALIASNVASLFSSAFNEVMGSFLDAAGFVTAYHLLKLDNGTLKTTVAAQRAVKGRLQKAVAEYGVAVKNYKKALSIRRADIARKSAALSKAAAALEKSAKELRKASEVNRRFHKRLASIEALRSRARDAGKRISQRTFRVAKAEVARIPAEGIPFVGAAVLVAGVAYDLHAMCQSMEDLDDLYQNCGMDDRVDQGWVKYICHPPIPTLD